MTYQPRVYRKQGGNELVVAAGGKVSVEAGGELAHAAGALALSQRFRVTAAEVNAGKELLAAIPGFKYRLIDWSMVAIGGNAATATSVDLLATQGAAGVTLAAVAVAALTRSAVVKPNSANVTVLADGASFVANDAATAITIGKTGGSLATATHVDVVLLFALEAA